MAKPEFFVFKSKKDDQWYFVLEAPNRKIICQSEGYTRKGNALKGIEAIIKYAKVAKITYC